MNCTAHRPVPARALSLPLRLHRALGAGWLCALLAAWPRVGAEAPSNGTSRPGVHLSPVFPVAGPRPGPGFTLLPPDRTGVQFTNRLSDATVAQNRLLELGSGVALGDVDGDGRVDVYFCSLEGDNVLYRNLGDWRFEDITEAAGVACPRQFSTGCVLVDLDGDGDLDLLVNSLGGGTRAFYNDGHARFTEAPDPGLMRDSGATSMALADVDGDGDLDLYVAHYRTDTFHDPPMGVRIESRVLADGGTVIEPRDRFAGVPTLSGGVSVLERGEADALYISRGGTHFVVAPWNVGVFLDESGEALQEPPRDWGLAVMFRDLNGDHLPDLYVCNDFVYWPDRLWLNQGGRRFQAAGRTALRTISLSSMSMDAADINRDGHDDFFVGEMLSPSREDRARQRPDTLDSVVRWPVDHPEFRPEAPRNTLQLSRGDGTWAEIAQWAGLAATDWTWSVAFLDVDLDGWEDLLMTTGNNHDVQDADVQEGIIRSGSWRSPERRLQGLSGMPRRPAPSLAFRNRRDLTFEDRSRDWGFDQRGIAHGMAFGDLDNDGDLDVVINTLHAPARLLRNDTTAPRLAVRLRGARANTAGIGGRIRVTGGPVTQTQAMIAGGRYLSGDEALRVFAAGDAPALEIEVTWRSGRRSVVPAVPANHVVTIEEVDTLEPAAAPAPPPPLFGEFPVHGATNDAVRPSGEFDRQPLLHRRLSNESPGISWGDADGDGAPDLIVAGAGGGGWMQFRNEGAAGFRAKPGPDAGHDLTSVLILPRPRGTPQLVAGISSWEQALSNTPPFAILGATTPTTPATPSEGTSTGPLALADVDRDGHLDLLVGGRVRAGRYPEPGRTRIFRGKDGEWTDPAVISDGLRVNGAVFTDVDGDGDPDLILACEWDSLRCFRNDGGTWVDATAASGLDRWRGLWNGVTTGDFDGDGRLDLVASNWGRNWRLDQTPAGPEFRPAPVELVFGEFGEPGVVHPLLVSTDPLTGRRSPWRSRRALLGAMPALADRAPTFRDFGRLDIEQLLGPSAAQGQTLHADTFDSMVFLNRGGRFEGHPLPMEAQWTPAFGVSVADFDGDGNEDLFLAQNFFGVDPETSRQDAGVGLLLLGDGRGGFRALGPLESGIRMSGEQRGSAVADADGDGRPDLAVGQHSGPPRIFRNVRGVPGVRVTVEGPPENPTAVGAVLRLRMGDRRGPAREIHAGAGFRSQDDATVVLATPETPTGLEVRWPGGRVQEFTWPAGCRSAVVRTEGIRAR
ncbi:MAG: VCBS repeat-containing protein [Verrucomicrobiae bacterium]|nr:VCBS repeat-containing protein [Verrucomicrobiae bacterium]